MLSRNFFLLAFWGLLLGLSSIGTACIDDPDSLDSSAPSNGVQPDVGPTDTNGDTDGCPPACDIGESCELDEHCTTNYCRDGACGEPSCDDGIQNGDETDIDCGGPDCPPCTADRGCELARDCQSGQCLNGECLPAATSCRQLADSARFLDIDLDSGHYRIDPVQNQGDPFLVYCDFDTDGGIGYTMARFDDAGLTTNQDDYRAVCAARGMELIVPRTRAHAQSILDFNDGSPPNLVGIYPQFDGASGLHNWEGRCQGQPCTFYLDDSNSAGCTDFQPEGNNTVDTALYRRDDGCFFGAWADGDDNYVQHQGSVICATNDVDPMPQPSCLDYRRDDTVHNAGPQGINGVYSLRNDEGAEYDAYCDMTTMGGGWTLAMKIDGAQSTFRYFSELWTNDQLHAPDAPELNDSEAKLQSFNDLSFSQLLVGMAAQPTTDPALDMRWLPLAVEGPSLHAVFSADEYIPTNAGRASWKGLIENSSLQCNCNLEGLNVIPRTGTDHSKVRVGILGNDQQHCDSSDSRLGLGGAGTACGQENRAAGHTTGCNLEGNYDPDFLSGNTQGCNPNDGDRDIPALGALMVRDVPITDSCEALYDAGITRSGIYPIAPEGNDPINIYCEMELAGGGWNLAAINGTDPRPQRWRNNDYPRPGASHYGTLTGLEQDVQNLQTGTDHAANYSIDASTLFPQSNREFLAFVSGQSPDFITGELPSGCNFFDGSAICQHNTYTGMTIYRSDGTVLTHQAQACTTGRGLIENDPFDEFGLHLIEGTAMDDYHCAYNPDAPLGHEGIGRIYTTFDSSNGSYWPSGVYSHWRDIGNGGELHLPGFLLLR